MSVVVTGVGACSAIGPSASQMRLALERGDNGCHPAMDERQVLPIQGFGHSDVDVRPFLKRRKDRKLLPRAAHLAIIAASEAYGSERQRQTGLFMGVGPEPSEVETESALVASMDSGKLCTQRLYRDGVAKYPPLAALKTLPNLVLAHVAIQLDLQGECGTRAGETAAGLASIHAGYYSIVEGRNDVVLCGAAESLVDAATARDVVRAGLIAPNESVGEAAAFLRLESRASACARGALILAEIQPPALRHGKDKRWISPIENAVGYCGVASAVLWMVTEIMYGRDGQITAGESSGAVCSLSWAATTV